LLSKLRGRYRLILPDLPGFGASTTRVSGYSIEAQASNVLRLLDHLEIRAAHILGDGLGGGVALNLYAIAPERVDSLTLISTHGIQELELLGDYTLNHAVHGAQLFYAWLFYEGTPNFGVLDRAGYNLSYARSYYETDQRPLRNILLTVDVPTLIIHGEKNLLVPIATAKEHARLIPHSRTEFLPSAGRRLLANHAAEIAPPLIGFIGGVSRGEGLARKDSTKARAEASTAPFDYHSYEGDLRRRVLFIVILLAIATLVSEDITCITAGLLVSQGAIGFVPATLGCLIGIFIGDTGLYLIGRILGVRALRIPPLKWFVDAQKIERSKKFFDRYGPFLIVVTRWLPGMRIPTYVAGGMLKLNFFKFLFYFLCAAIIWTPALVGISTIIGERLLGWLHRFEQHALLVLVLTIAAVLFTVHLALALATHRGRQLLKGKWHRRMRWQYWPRWLTMLPLLPYLIYLTVRNRCRPPKPITPVEAPHLPLAVVGDGERTLEFLILDNPETLPEAKYILDEYTSKLEDVPGRGENVPLPISEHHIQFRDSTKTYLQTLHLLTQHWRQAVAGASRDTQAEQSLK
jgi:membrane protein DedA with SNARE-associated domain/pimeloyl-ACP methyl ester carboxylesterase